MPQRHLVARASIDDDITRDNESTVGAVEERTLVSLVLTVVAARRGMPRDAAIVTEGEATATARGSRGSRKAPSSKNAPVYFRNYMNPFFDAPLEIHHLG